MGEEFWDDGAGWGGDGAGDLRDEEGVGRYRGWGWGSFRLPLLYF